MVTTEGLIGRAILASDPIDRAAAEDLAELLMYCQKYLADVRRSVLVVQEPYRGAVYPGVQFDAVKDKPEIRDLLARSDVRVIDGRDYTADGRLRAGVRKARAAQVTTSERIVRNAD